MVLQLLDAPRIGKLSRDLSHPKVLGTYSDEPSALVAVLQLSGELDPDRLVLARAGRFGRVVAEGHHLVAWARLEGLGTPRARWSKDGETLLCGRSTCGGALARRIRSGTYPVEDLVHARAKVEREGLSTWRVRGEALRQHRGLAKLHPERQEQAMARGPRARGIVANFISENRPDDDVVLLECLQCAPKVGLPAVSIFVPQLDTETATY